MKAEKSKAKPAQARRDFLKLASLGSLAAGAALATGAKTAESAEAPAAAGKGYRETAHVKTYYDLAKF